MINGLNNYRMHHTLQCYRRSSYLEGTQIEKGAFNKNSEKLSTAYGLTSKEYGLHPVFFNNTSLRQGENVNIKLIIMHL